MAMQSKGLAWVWGAFIIMMLSLSLVYTFFSRGLGVATNQTIDALKETNATTGSKFSSYALRTFDILDKVWKGFLLIFLIFALVWIVVQAHRRSSEYAIEYE